MNLDVRAGRNWRRSRKKGVSPIIATILLVAITVVLAAVLYVLISGLTKGPGNTPLGSAFAWGSPSTITGTSSTPGCATGDICYSLEINAASSGLTASQLTFAGRTNGGGAVSLGTNATLVSVGGLALTAKWVSSNACAGVQCTTVLAPGQTIVFDTGGATDKLAGDYILAVGTGSFSGTVLSGVLA